MALGYSLALLQLMLNVVGVQTPPGTAQHLNSTCYDTSTLSLLGSHQRPPHCCHQGTESQGAPQNPSVTILPHPIQPQQHKGTGEAQLVLSSIHSGEKLEEQESLLEKPEEKISSCFTFPPLDIKSGQSVAVGSLCSPQLGFFFCGFGFFFKSRGAGQPQEAKDKLGVHEISFRLRHRKGKWQWLVGG